MWWKMKKIDDESFSAIFKTNKFKELYDFGTVEVRAAIIVSIISIAVSTLYIKVNGINEYVSFVGTVFWNIGIALIGFLGFVVTGLAILTGSISGKIVNYMKKRNVYDCLYEILLSFYFIGFLIAIQIIITFLAEIIINIKLNAVFYLSVLFVFLMVYLFVFIIFYSVGLIGNCVSVFSITSDIENNLNQEEEKERELYNSYRIIALENIILKSANMKEYDAYEKKIDELIKKDSRTSELQKDKLIKFKKKHFDKE